MCTDCTPNGPILAFKPPSFPCNSCEAGDCPGGMTDAGCVNYHGPDLPCIGAATDEKLAPILQKIDARLCDIGSGPLPVGNVYCLAPLSGAGEFIEKISQRFCSLESSFNLFSTTTFPGAINTVNSAINALNHPALSSGCEQLGFDDTDTVRDVLGKIASQLCMIYDTTLNLSGVDWTQCLTIEEPPVTLQQGFNLVLDQICLLRSQLSVTGSDSTLTFDNTGTCLPSPGAADNLETTIIKMRSRLCATPVFSATGISSGCLTITGTDTLEGVVNKIVAGLSDLHRNTVRAVDASQFSLTPLDPANPCAGKLLSLNATVADRKVAATAADNNPGTLVEKLAAGANVTIDSSSVPGKVVIAASGGVGGEDAYKVMADAGDDQPDYLGQKIMGVTNSLSAIVATVVDKKVNIENLLDVAALAEAFLEVFENDPDLKSRLCMLISTCPSPCDPPTNVQAIAV